jgi:CheY-like chemotaxis protein
MADAEARRILILDDEESYRQILGRLLERRGYEVRSASEGDEALALGRVFQPDLLVVDWMLGGSQVGPEIAKALKARLPQLRTILITGYLRSQLRDELDACDIDCVLEKPFQLDEFMRAVEAALGHAPA